MEIEVLKPVKINVTMIRCEIPLRHSDDQEEYADFPGRFGKMITIDLDIDTASVRNWPGGARRIHTKPCDEGTYRLFDSEGEEVASLEQEYVPRCIPSEYGDYFVASIEADGKITGWRPSANHIADWFFGGER